MPGKKQFVVESVFRAVDRVTRPVGRMQQRIMRFTSAMRRGLKRVDNVVNSIARGLMTGFRTGAVVAAIAVTALALEINKLANDLDTLAKQSKRLDFPIEELQEWQFAAEQSGVESDVFTKSIDKFSKTLGELKGGYGAMETGLKKTNPQLRKQLKATDDIGEAMEIYINAMRETKGASQQAALGTLAFGRAGFKMVTLANTSKEGIAALRAEMRANGVATMEQAEAAEAYNDALNSAKLAGTGFIRSVLTPMLPMLTDAAKWVREWAIQNRELVTAKILEWGRAIVDNWSLIVDWIKKIGKGIAVFFALSAALKLLIGILTVVNLVMAANPIGLIVVAIAAIVAAVSAAIIWADELKAAWDSLGAPIKTILKIMAPLMGPLAWMIAAAVAIKTNWGPVKEFMIDLWTSIQKAASDTVEWLKDAAVSLVNAWISVKNFFIDMWNTTVNAFESAVNYLMQTGPISWILAAVALIMRHWEPISGFFEMIWLAVTDVFSAGVEMVKAVVIPLVDFFKSVWGRIVGVADTAVDTAVKSGAIAKIIDAANAIKGVWDELPGVFGSIWDGIVSVVDAAVSRLKQVVAPVVGILNKISEAKNKLIGEEIGFMGSDDVATDERIAERGAGWLPQVIGSEERIARSIEERNTRSTAELTIRDETGRGQITDSNLGTGMTLAFTGEF